jgi:hypothetical protein
MSELLRKIKNYEKLQLLINGAGTPLALPSHVTCGATSLMGGNMTVKNEVDDLMYDWINILKCKSDGVYAYNRYLADAEKEKSKCCEVLLNRLIAEDSKQILEVKRHVLGLLEKDSKTRGYTAA